jgi:tetratricopeptide (TPR) repeat protein
MLRHLAESEQIVVGDDGRWRIAPGLDVATIGLPESVRETVGRRLRRLADEAIRALSVAAVIGREFSLATLAAVDEASEDELLGVLEDAERAALVAEVHDVAGQFSFVSGLIRQTIYDDLSATRQSRMHQRIAEALEIQFGADPGQHIGELAHHWMAAGLPNDTAKAVEYARRAGDRALEMLAPDDAVRWYSAAIELVADRGHADEASRIDLLVGLGKAQRQAGMPAFRETLLDASRRAKTLGDRTRLIDSVLANSRGLFSSAGKIDGERIAMLDVALDAVGDADTTERALILGRRGLESVYAGDYAQRRVMSDEAVAIARRLGDSATLAWVLTFRHETIRLPETVEERRSLMAEARALAAGIDDPSLSYWANSLSAHPALEVGDMDGVDSFHDAAHEIAESIGQPLFTWHSAYHESWAALVRGDDVESERLATLALEKGTEAGEPDAFAIYGSQLVSIRLYQGRLGELVELLEAAKNDNPGIPAYAAAYALALAESGATDRSNAIVDEALANEYRDHQRDNLWLAGMTVQAMSAIDLGRADAAAVLYGLLEHAGGQVASTGASVFAVVDLVLGGLQRLIGDLDVAIEHLERADETARRMHAPSFIALNNVELAKALRQRDVGSDAARATALLTDAIELAEPHACGYALKRARELLSAGA